MTTRTSGKTTAKTAVKATAKKAVKKSAAKASATTTAARRRPAKATASPAAAAVDERPRNADLPIEVVLVHPRNARRELRDMEELADSIRAVGILQDAVVAPHPDQAGMYWLIAGHRRREGCVMADKPTLPSRIRWDLTTELDILTAMAVENGQRDDLTPLEWGVLYEQMALLGLDDVQIAQRTGRKADTVRRRRQLLDLPEAVRERVQHREVTLGQAEELAQFADDPAALRELLRALDGDSEIGYPLELQKQRTRREKARLRREVVAQLEAMGVDVVADDALPNDRKLRVLYGIPHDAGDTRQWQIDREGTAEHTASGCTARLVATVSLGGWVSLGCLDPRHAPADGLSAAGPGAAAPVPGAAGPIASDPAAAPAGGGEVTSPGLRERMAEQARLAAEQREAEALQQEGCTAARHLREEHLRSLISGHQVLTPPMRDAVVRFVALAAVRTDEPFGILGVAPYADWLGLDGELLEGDEDEERHGLEEALHNVVLRLQDPVRALLAAIAAAQERYLSAPHLWAPRRLADPESTERQYLRLVDELGYGWTPWETACFAAADQEAAAVAGVESELEPAP